MQPVWVPGRRPWVMQAIRPVNMAKRVRQVPLYQAAMVHRRRLAKHSRHTRPISRRVVRHLAAILASQCRVRRMHNRSV